MKAIALSVWRMVRIFVGCAIGVVILLPQDKWFSRETLAIAIGAGIVGVSKFLREQYGFDIKIV